MKKQFETPEMETISMISEAVATGLPGTGLGVSDAFTPED